MGWWFVLLQCREDRHFGVVGTSRSCRIKFQIFFSDFLDIGSAISLYRMTIVCLLQHRGE